MRYDTGMKTLLFSNRVAPNLTQLQRWLVSLDKTTGRQARRKIRGIVKRLDKTKSPDR
jgi:hypothetical protein